MSDEQWRRTIAENVDSVFYTTRAAIRAMSDHGRIVLVSSTAGQRGEAFHADYGASKGAVISLVKSLAPELAQARHHGEQRRAGLGRHRDVRRAVLGRRARTNRGEHSDWADRDGARHRRPDRVSVLGSRATHHGRDRERERRQRALRMIVLLFTGGTISMRHDPAAGGAVPTLTRPRDRRAGARHRPARASRVDDWGAFPGPHMTPDRMWALRERIRRASRAAGRRRHRRHARNRFARRDGLPAWRAPWRATSRSSSPARCARRAISDGTGPGIWAPRSGSRRATRRAVRACSSSCPTACSRLWT